MTPEDWPVVAEIYAEGIATGNATFQTEPPEWPVWDRAHLPECRLVAERYGEILGWAALSPYSRREVYRGVAELSIYVRASARGQGIGRALMERVIADFQAAGFWTLQAGVFPENTSSLGLLRGFGFREVGRRERIGCMEGRWRDVILLERRSADSG
jgi:L-amino acid N-acyltransferase YncA